MTKEEFQKQYHEYMTPYGEKAKKEAAKVNRMANGFSVVATYFPDLGMWCLMLKDVAEFVKETYNTGV